VMEFRRIGALLRYRLLHDLRSYLINITSGRTLSAETPYRAATDRACSPSATSRRAAPLLLFPCYRMVHRSVQLTSPNSPSKSAIPVTNQWSHRFVSHLLVNKIPSKLKHQFSKARQVRKLLESEQLIATTHNYCVAVGACCTLYILTPAEVRLNGTRPGSAQY